MCIWGYMSVGIPYNSLFWVVVVVVVKLFTTVKYYGGKFDAETQPKVRPKFAISPPLVRLPCADGLPMGCRWVAAGAPCARLRLAPGALVNCRWVADGMLLARRALAYGSRPARW